MSREILFKAKRKNWRELPKEEWWVEGDVIHEPYGIVIQYCDDKKRIKVVVAPETLCQYTGLNDNTKWEELTGLEKETFLSKWNYQEDRKNKVEDWNGRKIWENDILRNEKGDIGVVQWFEEHAAFMIWNKTKHYVCYLAENDFSKIEIAGNEFDNAELLEVE